MEDTTTSDLHTPLRSVHRTPTTKSSPKSLRKSINFSPKSVRKSVHFNLPGTPQQQPAEESSHRRATKRLFFESEETEKKSKDEEEKQKPEKKNIISINVDDENGEENRCVEAKQADLDTETDNDEVAAPVSISKSPNKKLKSEHRQQQQQNTPENPRTPAKPSAGESVRRSGRLLRKPPIIPDAPQTPAKTVKSKTKGKNPAPKSSSSSSSVKAVDRENAPKTPAKTVSKAAKTPIKTPAKASTAKPPLVKTPAKTPPVKTPASTRKNNARKFFDKVKFSGEEYRVGDCVYVKRVESSSDSEELDEDLCKVCGRAGEEIMLECDECLGGFHLPCLKPPLKEVPQDSWMCMFCTGAQQVKQSRRSGLRSRKVRKTCREKLLSSQMWAARIERIWRMPDGSYWFTGQWYAIPEETAVGRQPHNLKRELFLTNNYDDNEMDSIIKHCYVKRPKEFEKATEGDDVYLCEYEYDSQWQTFKRLEDADIDEEENSVSTDDDDWRSTGVSDDSSDSDGDTDDESWDTKQRIKEYVRTPHSVKSASATPLNAHKGHLSQLQKVGAKSIPERVWRHKQTNLEKAKCTLMLASSPESLPCRNKEMYEITAFVTGALAAGSQCLGRCLYIHGVPGTGKTATVLTVMRNLRTKVASGTIQPYRFVAINGLKLSQPENLYKSLYEALTGHRVGWKTALKLLNQRFSESKKPSKDDNQPCVLLVDELDLLVTRNQSVLYNIFDWPTRATSRLIVIGIANTMDLPEKLLPRIASRMGLQRLCFGPYSHQQLQEIISSRLNGLDAFEKQAIEFASRKVAAVSGDARRALELCRRAAEVAEFRIKQSSATSEPTTKENNSTEGKVKGLVGMSDIDAAIHEMFQAPHIQVMKRCSRIAKTFLVAMVHEYHKTGMMETTFEKIAICISFLCTANGEHCPDWDTLFSVGCRLGACRLLLSEPGSRHRFQKLQLNFPSDDVAFALREDKDVLWASKYL